MFKKLSSLALSVLFLVSASTVNATASDKESEQKLLSENEEVTLFEDIGLTEEADHITEYRNSGYDVVYIKSGGTDDGTSIDRPKACTDLRAAIKAVEDNENKKVVLAVVGGIGCGTSGNDTTEKGFDIVVTSATGVYSASADYINMTSGDIALIGGNSYTFDKIHFETSLGTTTYLYAAGAESVTITEDTTSNGDNAQNGNTKRFAVGFGMNTEVKPTYAGGTITVKSDVRVLNTALAYRECTITGDVASITEDSSIGYLYVGGAGYISGNATAQINGGYVNNLYNLATGSVGKNVVVEINDGATINNLFTRGETAWTKVNGDYVIYLNDGTINTVSPSKDPDPGCGVLGKTILVVNDDTANVPANISGLPYLVSFTGDGNVVYNTESDKLELKCGANSNKITVNGNVIYGNTEIELTGARTTVEFGFENIVTTANATFDANGGFWGDETTKTVETTIGEVPTAPENPILEGFEFKGWTPELTAITSAGATYTAVWEKIIQESDHIKEYRSLGYDIVYIKADGNGDGTKINAPMACTDLRAAIKALEEKTTNKKIVLAVIGGIGCSTSGNETTEKGYDIVVTSATGTYSASADYINMTAGDAALIGGNSYIFDKIHFETKTDATTYLYAAGAENVTITEDTTSNGDNVQNGNTKRFAVGFGMKKTNTTYAGGTINVKADVRVLNTAIAYSECNITGDVAFITEDSSIGYLYVGGAGYISGNASAQINGGYVNNLYNLATGSVSKNVIVEINDGAVINNLYTTGETAWTKVNGDYVIYLNDGTINIITKAKDPQANAGVIGKTILIVNDNTANVPANISGLPYLVSFTGDGTVKYENDKLVLAPGAEIKYVKVTNGDNTTTYDVEDGSEVELLSDNVIQTDIASGTTTVEFLSDGTIKPEITITPNVAEVEKGKNIQLAATVTPDEYDVVWSIVTDGISDGTTISEDGCLTVAENETSAEIIVKATITAETREFSATSTVTVKKKAIVNVTKDIKITLARENGNMPISLAKLRIYKDSTKSELVSEYALEDAETTSSEVSVSVTLTEGTYFTEIVKNGYLTYKTDIMVTDGGISIDNIVLVPGDIKGSFEDECGDGVIDIDDFVRVLRGFASDTNSELSNAVDINEDGFVNVSDIAFVKANLGKSAE